MPNESPEIHKPSLTPEQAGGDFYESAKAVHKEQPFYPDYAKSETAEQAARILQGAEKKPAAEVHFEAGFPMATEYKSEEEKRKALEMLMQNGIRSKKAGTDAYEATRQLGQMLEDEHMREDAA